MYRATKRRISRAFERHVVNPIVRRRVFSGHLGPTYAVLETTGRRTGRSRRTPVANGLQGNTFWLISAHGRHGLDHDSDRPRPRALVSGCRAR